MELMDDDIIYEMPFGDPSILVCGKDNFRALLEKSQGKFSHIRYDIRANHYDDECETATVEAMSSRKIVSTGESCTIRGVFIFGFKNDLVIAMREYVHPLDAAAAQRARSS